MDLSHYGSERLGSIYSVLQQGEAHVFQKPSGLWVSVDGPDDWPSWCISEDFNLIGDGFKYRHKVYLEPDAPVLELHSHAELYWFDSYYANQYKDYMVMTYIDWNKVADDYFGIIIAPYIWGRRIVLDGKCQWYYGWDCTSGCIWDSRAIASIVLDTSWVPPKARQGDGEWSKRTSS